MEPGGADRKNFPSDRLVAFTDAVMAVAITLLVLGLKLPASVTDAALPSALASSSHSVWCYVLSFLVISSCGWRITASSPTLSASMQC